MARKPIPRPNITDPKFELPDYKHAVARLAKIVQNVATNNQPWSVLLKRDHSLKDLFERSGGLSVGAVLSALKDERVCMCCGKVFASNSVCKPCAKTKRGKKLILEIKRWKMSDALCSRTAEQKAEHLAKMQATCRERYGVDNPYQAPSIKRKIKKIHREKLGVDYPGQSRSVQKKMKKSLLRNYGSKGLSHEDIQSRRMIRSLEKHGVSHHMKRDDVKARVRVTVQERYGVDSPAQDPEVRKRIVRTNQRRYGVDCVFDNEEVQAKKQATCLKKFGSTSPFSDPVIVKRSQETSMKRFGVRHYMQDPVQFAAQTKSRFARKTVEINGKAHSVQGFEGVVLKKLEKNINRLTTCPVSMPDIRWKDAGGTTHRYFPDALVESKSGVRYLLEVKSTYSIRGLSVVLKAIAAWKAAKAHDLSYYVVLVESDGTLTWIDSARKLRKRQNELYP